MAKVLVTGGCGYIGSHTLVELLAAGHAPVSIDDNSRSSESILDGVEKITGKRKNYRIDLRSAPLTKACFPENRDAIAVIHLAAYKTVPESVAKPLHYYDNNVNSLLNVLESTDEYGIPGCIFSSSCAVYGNPKELLPITEDTPLGEAECPYARTKQIGERIIQDFSKVSRASFVSLRYFNPAGAHPSGEIGEVPYGEPDNLVPRITRTATGKLPEFVVHGNDYDTRDGTCIRDYVHVSDIGRAHVLAIDFLQRSRVHRSESGVQVETFNLGSGIGTTVLEAVRAFERATSQTLNHRVRPRRSGDVEPIYANNGKAAVELGWDLRFDIDEMMRSAWTWEQKLANSTSRQAKTEVEAPASGNS